MGLYTFLRDSIYAKKKFNFRSPHRNDYRFLHIVRYDGFIPSNTNYEDGSCIDSYGISLYQENSTIALRATSATAAVCVECIRMVFSATIGISPRLPTETKTPSTLLHVLGVIYVKREEMTL